MSDDNIEPSKAAMLAALVTRNAEAAYKGTTVQRSHRFPVHLIAQIENLAHLGGVSVSMVINDLLDVGLDALKKELPVETAQKISHLTKGQIDRPTVTDYQDSKRHRSRQARKAVKK